MRGVLVITGACLFLTGCGSAAASEPDSRNPAHCIAPGDEIARLERPHPEWTEQYRAAMVYEMEKLKKSGRSVEDAKAEGVAFTKAYWKDSRMPSFVLECVRAQARDPNFKAELPRLMEIARHTSGGAGR